MQHVSIRKGWFSNTSFTTGLKTLPTFRPNALVFFRAKKTRASGRNVGKVFNPVVKLVLENQPFLMPEPAEKPSLQHVSIYSYSYMAFKLCIHVHHRHMTYWEALCIAQRDSSHTVLTGVVLSQQTLCTAGHSSVHSSMQYTNRNRK